MTFSPRNSELDIYIEILDIYIVTKHFIYTSSPSTEAQPGSLQISKMENFSVMVNDF